ncbi:MAG: MotE family protein [Alphaproteobacteria bacterium]
MKIRFLPYMIIASIFMLVVKIEAIIESSKNVSELFSTINLSAKQEEQSEHKSEDKEAKDEGSEHKSEGKEAKEEGSEHSSGEGDKKKSKEEESLDGKISKVRPKEFDCKKTSFSDIDIEILQSLSKRREEIEKSNNELITKQTLLTAAEEKLDKKLQDLKSLKDEVSGLLDQYNQKEDMKIGSLVKIYENMKPKEAAKIFEGLEMPLLLQVLDKMKEAKTAPILAQMNPQKATELTVEFAKQKKFDPIAN